MHTGCGSPVRSTESFPLKVNASFPNPRPAASSEQDLPCPAKPNLVALAFEHRYRVAAHRYTGLRLRLMQILLER